MRASLIVCGYALLLPVCIGIMIRVAVYAYRGEDYSVGYVGMGVILACVIWGAVSKRFAKPAPVTEPTKSTVYDWNETDDGVEFYARREDGTEHKFFIGKGTGLTRTERTP